MSLPDFGVRKPVPVNLLMMGIIIAGLYSALTMRREFFPETKTDSALVELIYQGASPSEIEETLAMKVEDKLVDLDEVKSLRTTLSEGGGGIVVEFSEGVTDVSSAIDEIERAIDSLKDLPDGAEKIRVSEFEPRIPVIMLTLYGHAQEAVLKQALVGIKDEIKSLPAMGDVVVSGMRDYEVRVDVDREALLAYGISLPEITDRINKWMADVPGGTVRTGVDNIKIRTLGVEEHSQAIKKIIISANAQGQIVRLGDIATVRDYFVDSDLITRFNGQFSGTLIIYKLGKGDIVKMAESVRSYYQGHLGKSLSLTAFERLFKPHKIKAYELGKHSQVAIPAGTTLAVHSDYSRFVVGRLDLLLRNALQGGILVFATLLFFLNWRAAFWVGMGLVTALLGTLVLMQWLNVTLNLLTMFGLILVLGLLVDDGIVVSEIIQQRHDEGEPALTAAVKGAERVFWPVIATVLTSVVAFLPLRFVEGRIGDLMGALPLVVMCALLMSLIESLLILPSHMGHSLHKRDIKPFGHTVSILRRFEHWRDRLVFEKIVPAYGKLLSLCLRYRYISLALAIGVLVISFGLVAGGRIAFVFLPKSDAETLLVDLRLPVGAPISRTNQVVAIIEKAVRQEPEVLSVSTTIGRRANVNTGQTEAFAPHIAQLFIELTPAENRNREAIKIVGTIRHRLEGKISDVEKLSFQELTGGPGGDDITLEITGQEMTQIQQVVKEIKQRLSQFSGVQSVSDDNDLAQREMQITIKPAGAVLGLTTDLVAKQVRASLYGLDAHVFNSKGEDVDVRVRLDQATRRDLVAILNTWIITQQGRPVPLQEIAEVQDGLTYATIHRVDRKRTVTVAADLKPNANPNAIVQALQIETLQKKYPNIELKFGGRQKREAEAFASLPRGIAAAMIMIYVILAWLFSSYLQPIVVMLAIPFSLIGVILGHMALGYDLTFLSVIGFVALSGVVVNDSLILMDLYNQIHGEGMAMIPALIESGKQRLRPILLTSITTVLGLTPLIFERSFQAKFLIPMGISISGGLISATVLILLILPCVLVVVTDIKEVAHFLWFGISVGERAAQQKSWTQAYEENTRR